jgi:hypothetical protein
MWADIFKASIGFSIPITRMFNGSTVWRGVIYTILMLVAKLVCGAWLVRFAMSLPRPVVAQKAAKALKSVSVPHLWGKRNSAATSLLHTGQQMETTPAATKHIDRHHTENKANTASVPHDDTISPANDGVTEPPSDPDTSVAAVSRRSKPATKPFSLYPGAILGLAMVSRGEIGFLISSLAESNGILSSGGNDQVFLIVTWAIVLCTIIGPVGVGLLVRRVKTLEKKKEEGGGGRDVLGVWGVS